MNSDNQNKYDDFVAEIHVRKNLAEVDRMQFYKLHREVTNPNVEALYALIFELRDQKRYNEHYILIDEERTEIFEFLEKKRLSEVGRNASARLALRVLVGWFKVLLYSCALAKNFVVIYVQTSRRIGTHGKLNLRGYC